MFEEYQWIVVVTALVAFVCAYGIGANDVANAFATSVGSKTLTLRQALAIGAVMEFAGALLLGANVTSTIAGSIAQRAAFAREPEVLMYGMLCALTAAATWLLVATYLELPVSTTHSIVGAVMGMALAWGGPNAVIWEASDPEFPFVRGFVVIVVSWFLSPVVSAVAAALFFLATRTLVLRRRNSAKLAFYTLPLIVGLCVFIMTFFVLYKGAQRKYYIPMEKCAWIAAVVGAGCALLTTFIILPILRKRLDNMSDEPELSTAAKNAELEPVDEEAQSTFGKMRKAALAGVDYDIHKAVEEDSVTAAMHARAEKFDPKAEEAFKYVQVFTAMADSFSHGANDVANAIGPFAAVWTIYNSEAVARQSQVPIWILVLGGAGIVLGLGTYGFKIMKALGVQSVVITPSRGYCIELSSALVIAIGSRFGLPLSTTHCQVGGTYGVGLVEGIGSVNVTAFLRYFAGWVFTVIFTAFLSALLFLQGTAAPSRAQSKVIRTLENGVQNTTLSLYRALNTTNQQFAGTPLFNATLNTAVNESVSKVNKLYKKQNIAAVEAIKFLQSSVSMYRTQSVLLIGNRTCSS